MKNFILWFGHPCLGALTPFIGYWVGDAYAVMWVFLFCLYELTEARHLDKEASPEQAKADVACWDIRDYLIGYGFGLLVFTFIDSCTIVINIPQWA